MIKDDQPVVYRPYRILYIKWVQLLDIIDELKKADIAEDDDLSYASHIFLVKKENDDVCG